MTQQRWCFDLDGTIDAHPAQMGALMRGLRSHGHLVTVLSGCGHDQPTPAVIHVKQEQLRQLGLHDAYDHLAVVGGPSRKKIAKNKVRYMRHVGATALIDNDHKNIHAARKAGFLAFRPH